MITRMESHVHRHKSGERRIEKQFKKKQTIKARIYTVFQSCVLFFLCFDRIAIDWDGALSSTQKQQNGSSCAPTDMIANMQAINDSVGRILHVRVRSILRLSVAKPKIQTGHFFSFFFFLLLH